MSKKNKQEKINKEIQNIIEAAQTGGENKICKELTFAQACSIRIRSKQIKKELKEVEAIEAELINKQIDECWKQWYG